MKRKKWLIGVLAFALSFSCQVSAQSKEQVNDLIIEPAPIAGTLSEAAGEGDAALPPIVETLPDASVPESGTDTGTSTPDTSVPESGTDTGTSTPDTSVPESGTDADTSTPDTSVPESGTDADTSTPDTSVPESGTDADTSTPDTSVPESGTDADTSTPDTSVPESGTDAGTSTPDTSVPESGTDAGTSTPDTSVPESGTDADTSTPDTSVPESGTDADTSTPDDSVPESSSDDSADILGGADTLAATQYGLQALPDGRTVYVLPDGTYAAGEVNVPGLGWAYFSPDSFGMVKNQFYRLPDGRLVYYNEQGAMLFGNQNIGEWPYQFSPNDGNLVSVGEQYVPGKGWGYIEPSTGYYVAGFYTLPDTRYVYYNNGWMAFGPTQIGNFYYNFSTANGSLLTGEFYVPGGGWAYTEPSTLRPIANQFYRLPDSRLVYYNEQGFMLMGKQSIGEWPYEFSLSDGSLISVGEQYVPGKGWGYIEPSTGYYVAGFYTLPDTRYVYYNNGWMAFGPTQIGDFYYNFSTANGSLLTGEFYVPGAGWAYTEPSTLRPIANQFYRLPDSRLVYYNERGFMLMGKQSIGEWPYEFSLSDGSLISVGEQYIPGKGWGYIDPLTGYYVAGIYTIADGRTVYYKDGIMSFGWNDYLGNRYYFDQGNGNMLRGWQKLQEMSGVNIYTYYFFPESGIMAKGNVVIDNKQYTFDSSGALLGNYNKGVLGIDVSQFQGVIDWSAVKASGVNFVIIRVLSSTNAGPYIDQYFHTNMQGALSVGLQVGAYIYSYGTTYEYMLSEVTTAITALNPYKNQFTYPVYIDYEDPLNWQKNLTKDQHTDLIRYGMNILAQNGYLPGFYTYYNAANTYINTQQLINEGYDFWVAHYSASSNPWPNAGVWQYSSSGSVPGISGRVDMNYSYRDYSQINRSMTVYDVNTGTQVTAKIKDLVPQIVQNEVGGGLGLTGTDAQKLYKVQAVCARSYLEYYLGIGQIPSVGLRTPSSEVTMSSNIVSHLGVYYDGAIINAAYGSCSGPYTNSAANMGWGNYPYLTTVESPYDSTVPGAQRYYPMVSSIGVNTMRNNIIKMVGQAQFNLYANDMNSWITAVNKDAYGNISSAVVCGVTISGGKFYENCWGLYGPSLNSWSYDGNGTWTFSTNGNGHGVGMSQYGAAAYILKGQDWQWILNHYYPNTVIM